MILRGPDAYLVVSLETKSPTHLPQASSSLSTALIWAANPRRARSLL